MSPGGPQRGRLPDGRLHLQHGPIDLIVEATGRPAEVERAYEQAGRGLEGVLAALVGELALLRTPVTRLRQRPRGAVAARMVEAVAPFQGEYVTPMAAVAGAVADAVLSAAVAGRELERAYVNNGGDIALHLAPGAAFVAGVVADLAAPTIAERVLLTGDGAVRGLATSGWRGRSWSRGIADAVTVFARSAAAADAAATLVANAVFVDDPAVQQAPAHVVFADGDLADLPLTVNVDPLTPAAVRTALEAGARRAAAYLQDGHILGALLYLEGERGAVGCVGAPAASAGTLIPHVVHAPAQGHR
jgi:hypothetical protein